MILSQDGVEPAIHPTARVAASAVISGNVQIGPNCSIGHGAVIVAEGGPVRIGANCVIMETAVLRGVPGHALRIGSDVIVGPRAYLVGCEIEDEVFIATGGTVFNGARVGRGAEVRINALVHLRTVIEPGATVPIGWVAVGEPAAILPADRHEEIWAIQKTLDFPGTVFHMPRPGPGESFMAKMMPRYASALVRRGASEQVVAAQA